MDIGVYNVRWIEIYTDESLLPEPSSFEVDIGVEKLKRSELPGVDQIVAEVIQARF